MSGVTSRKQKVLLTLGGGGYLWEALRLLDSLGSAFDYAYVTGSDCLIPDRLKGAEVHKLCTITRKDKPHRWQHLANLLVAFKQALHVIKMVKPDAIICVAAPFSVPLAIAANIFGKRVIYVESIARVDKPSVTGKIISTLRLSDRIYVQWPNATHLYRNAVYKGTVL